MNIDDLEVKFIHLAEVDSTNNFVKKNHAELEDLTLVYADMQTAGRGRLDRTWISRPGNFFGTFLLKKLPNPFLGTMAVSLAALDALKKLAPEVEVWLKWPNDLYIEECKAAGILSESIVQNDNTRCIAVGLGVNLAWDNDGLSLIDKPAASVGNGKINPGKFASELAKYAKLYYIMGIACSEKLFELWRKRNYLVGMELVLELTENKSICGTAVRIAPDGALIIRTADGSEKPYYCGDVSVSRKSVQEAYLRKKAAEN